MTCLLCNASRESVWALQIGLPAAMTHQGVPCQELLRLEPVHSEATDGSGPLHHPQLLMAAEDAQVTTAHQKSIWTDNMDLCR